MNRKDFSIVLCGEAGQGIQTVEKLLVRIFKSAGYNVFATKEYMSRVRGGCNSTQIRVSSDRVSAYIDRIDLLVPLNQGVIKRVSGRISSDTVILGDKENIEVEYFKKNIIFELPFKDIANEIGNPIFSNVIAVGVISRIFRCDIQMAEDQVRRLFAEKEEVITKNIEAVKRGFMLGDEIMKERVLFDLEKNGTVSNEYIINGSEAVAMGAIAGGCNFISAYPMSPSTGVFVFLCNQAEEFAIVTEQAEDELSAINMAVGAWYAGARAMVNTSGGGFALMEEGVSLAGMVESPLVIHLAQRPGPATGLPTRTEQGDLEFALYSGHGEFPRIIFAPGKLEDAFYLTAKSFDLADKYQVPVFIITDQHLLDSYCNIELLETDNFHKYFIETKKNYQRYKLNAEGVSERGIPGYGEGFVCVDSDEHDESGHITEDLDFRVKIVEKRLRKIEGIKDDIIPPKFIGKRDPKLLVIGWGSTLNVINEALSKLNRKDVSFIHFNQVYPLPPQTYEYISKAQIRVVVENNATAQFARMIKLHTGIEVEYKILKYNGLPFSVEEVEQKILNILNV